MSRKLLAIIGGVILVGAVIGVANMPSGAAPTAITAETVVVDVRTPGEFAEGHLDDALLLDFSGGALAAALHTLDPHADYVVYCRSGNRSAQAVSLMRSAGFTNATDLGSMAQASAATGIPIVR